MTAARVALAGGRELALAAQMAAALMDGLDGMETAESSRFGELAAAPHFRAPLRRASARVGRLAELPLDPGFPARLRDQAESRLCALLVSQPVAAVRAAALRAAAAVFHRRLIGIVLKADRERLRTLLGDDAFAVATQEALLLDAPLVQLGLCEPPLDLGDLVALRARLAGVGAALLVRFALLVEPILADAVARRLPERASLSAGAAGAMAERHCGPIVKLLRRRGPDWATLIA